MNEILPIIMEGGYTETIKIRNCPFCAQIPDARMHIPEYGKVFLPHEIRCIDCDIIMRHVDAKTLVENWNRTRIMLKSEIVVLDR